MMMSVSEMSQRTYLNLLEEQVRRYGEETFEPRSDAHYNISRGVE
jgi:hypothetical protein